MDIVVALIAFVIYFDWVLAVLIFFVMVAYGEPDNSLYSHIDTIELNLRYPIQLLQV